MITKDLPRIGAVPAWSRHSGRRDTPLTYLLLAGVVALAALLRFWNLPSRGLLYWDEGKFALEGIRLHYAVSHLFGAGGPLSGKPVGTAKPLHALLVALSYGVVGVHDYAALLMNAACSAMAVLLLFFLARRLFDSTVGLLAALFLAVSEYDVIYARSALSESDATLLLLAGVLLWTYGYHGDRTETSAASGVWPLLSGLVMGLAFTANYRLLVYIAAIIILDLVWCWRQEGRRFAAQRVALWAAGLCVAPLLWHVAGLLADAGGVALFRADVGETGTSYLREVVYQLHEGKQSALRFQPLPYLQWYVVRESWPLFLLALIGLGIAVTRRGFAWLALAVPVLVPYLAFVFAPFVVPRNLTGLLPFASVLAAATVVTATRRVRSGQARLAVLLLAVVVLGGYEAVATWRLTGLRSGFARAAQYVDRHGGRALTSSEIMVFYLRGPGLACHAPAFPQHVRFLAVYDRWGYTYVVLDNHHTSQGTTYVRAHLARVARFAAEGGITLGESLISSENGSPPDPHARIEHVDVFRFGHLHRRPVPDRTSICSVEDVT